MDAHPSFGDPTNTPPVAINAVSVTGGMLVQEPEFMVGPAGELVAIVVLAVEGRDQASAWTTLIRQTYFIHAWSVGPVAERLATAPQERASAFWGRWTISSQRCPDRGRTSCPLDPH